MITKEGLKQFVESNPKLVTKKALSKPGLYILKYKKNVFWDNLWNEYLIECRGLVIDEDYNIISRPFTKIFNHHENGTTIDRDEECIAFRKVNGFMAAITWYEGDILVTTTGTDDSDFAKLADEMVRKRINMKVAEQILSARDEHENVATIIVEICHPSDPHIIPEKEGVYLLGLRDNLFDTENNVYGIWKYLYSLYDMDCDHLGLKRVEYTKARFSDICKMAKECDHEGFVVYGLKSGTNLKIKSPFYLMSKFLSRKNEEKLIKLIDRPDEIKKIVDEEYFDVVDYICSVKDEFVSKDEQGRLEMIREFISKD